MPPHPNIVLTWVGSRSMLVDNELTVEWPASGGATHDPP